MSDILLFVKAVFLSGVFHVSVFGNSISRYFLVLVVFVALSIAARILFKHILARFSSGSGSFPLRVDDVLFLLLRSIRPSFYTFVALYVSLKLLTLSESVERFLDVALLVFLMSQVASLSRILVDFFVRKKMRGKGSEGQVQNSAHLLTLIAQIVIWAFGALMILSNFGINVSSLIAGLGIGGIAVAFALQNILSDLFSSFAIHFDKPFVVGDFIIIDDKMGVVQRIGIKTTRIRALQGEEIIISNRELTTAKIQNFKRMRERRVQFSFGVTYETELEKLRAIPKVTREIIEKERLARYDRAHFQKFDDSALVFEVVYYLLSAEYNDYMDTQQNLNFAIMEAFKKEGIEFAYPTQVLYVKKAQE